MKKYTIFFLTLFILLSNWNSNANTFNSFSTLLTNENDTVVTPPNEDTIVTPMLTTFSLPFTYDFEDANLDTCPIFTHNPTLNQWHIGELGAYNSTRGLYLSCDSGATARYNDTVPSKTFASWRINLGNAPQFLVSFNWINNGDSCCDYLEAYLIPDNYIFNDTTPIDVQYKINPSNIGGMTDWQQYRSLNTRLFSDSIGQLVIVWSNDNIAGNPNTVAIDNIALIPFCFSPTSLQVLENKKNAISFSWSDLNNPEQWQLQYRVLGEIEWQTEIAYSTEHTLTNLASGTYYEVRVGTQCHSETYYYSGIITCNTLCYDQALLNFPWEENVENGLACWEQQKINGNVTWQQKNYFISNETLGNTYAEFSSTNSTQAQTMLISPTFDMRGVIEPAIHFTYNLPNGADTCNILQIYYREEADAEWLLLETWSDSTIGWIDTMALLPDSLPLLQFGFKGTNLLGSYIGLDNISIQGADYTCLAPLDIVENEIQHNSASFAWEVRNDITQWQVRVEETLAMAPMIDTTMIDSTQIDTNFVVPILEWIDINTNEYTFTNLLPYTEYSFQIRTICGEGDTSQITTSTFTTLVMPCQTIDTIHIDSNLITQTTATVFWEPTLDSTNLPSHYFVEYKIADSTEWMSYSETNENYIVLENLSPYTVYDVSVHTVCVAGDTSGYDTLSFTTLPNPCPTVRTISAIPEMMTDTSAVITWEPTADISNMETGFLIQYKRIDEILWDTLRYVTDTLLYHISNLEPLTNYEVRMQSICFHEDTSGWKKHIFTTKPVACPAIDSVIYHQELTTQTAATFSWIPTETPTNPETGYLIEYKKFSNDTWQYAGETEDTTFTITELTPFTHYEMRVFALCTAGDTSTWKKHEFVTLDVRYTVADGLLPNGLPFDGSYLDYNQHNQMIYPAEMLQGLNEKLVTKLSFYFEEFPAESSLWNNGATITIASTNVSSLSDSLVTNYEVIETIHTTSLKNWCSDGLLNIELSEPLQYDGNNILIDITTEATHSCYGIFYGIFRNGAGRMSNDLGINIAMNFLPKLTFTYMANPERYCWPVEGIMAQNIDLYAADITWNGDISTNHDTWFLQYRTENSTWSNSIVTDTAFATLTNLESNTTYQVRINATCLYTEGFTEWSEYTFTTPALPCPSVAFIEASEESITQTSCEIIWHGSENADNLENSYLLQYNNSNNEAWGEEIAISGNSYMLNNLIPFNQYEARVRAICVLGDTSEWQNTSFTTLPMPCPTPLAISHNPATITTTTAEVNWTPAQEISNPETEYILQYKLASTTLWDEATEITIEEPFKQFSGLLPNTSYDVRVRAVCTAGDESDWIEHQFTTNATEVILAAGETASNQLPFNGIRLNSPQHNQIVYPFEMLTELNGKTITKLTFYLKNYAAEVENWTSPITIQMKTSYFATVENGFQSTANTTTVISNEPIITWFNEEENTIEIPLTYPFVYDGANLLFDITTETGGMNYASFIGSAAELTGRYSDENNEAALSFLPKVKLDYTLTPETFCWTVSDIETLNLQPFSTHLIWEVGDNNNSWIVQYKTVEETIWSESMETAAPSIFINDLLENTNYQVRIRATCADESDLSGWEMTEFTTPVRPCSEIDTITHSIIATTEATMLWNMTDHNNDTGNFFVKYKEHSDDTWSTPISIQDTFYSISNLWPLTTYDFKVQLICNNGEETPWVSTTFTTLPVPCPEINELFANDESITPYEVTLGWAANEDPYQWIESYTLQYKPNNVADWNDEAVITFDELLSTTLDLDNLTAATTYQARVRINCISDLSAWSETTFTTLPAPCPDPTNLASETETMTPFQATLTWEASSTPSNWNSEYIFQYKPETISDWNAPEVITVPNLQETTTNLINLLPATTYHARVRAICSIGDTSQWITAEFTTLSNTFTVADGGTAATSLLPVNTSFLHEAQHNQMIYTADMLEALEGKFITKLTFFMSTPPSNDIVWTSSVNVKLGTTTQLSLTNDLASTDAAFTVATTAQLRNWVNGALLDIELSNPYLYEGGNILVDFSTTAGGISPAHFAGIIKEDAGRFCISTNNEAIDFLPQLMFTYEPSPEEYCAPVTYISANNITPFAANISWDIHESNTSWVLQYKIEEDAIWSSETLLNLPQHALTGLTENSNYEVRVRAHCAEYDENDESVWMSQTFSTLSVPCPEVTTLYHQNNSITETSATLVWALENDPHSWNNGYQLQYKSTAESQWITIENLDEETYTLTDLSPATNYQARVQSICIDGANTDWVSHNFTTTTPDCTMPAALTHDEESLTPTSAIVTWEAGDDPYQWNQGYALEYKMTQSSWSDLTTIRISDLQETSFEITDLIPNTSYDVRVQSLCNNGVMSDWINHSFTTSLPPCAPPTNVEATAEDPYSISLTWNGDADSYLIRYRTQSSTQWDSITSETSPITIDELTPETTYLIQIQSNCELSNSAWIPEPAITATTLTVKYTITATTHGPGTIYPAGVTEYEEGSTPLYTFVPEAGGIIKRIEISGVEIPVGGNQYMFPPLTDNETIDIYFSGVGIDENETLKNITLYPNPAQSHISIKTDGVEITGLDIIDMTGRLVMRPDHNEYSNINISNLENGVYFVRITTNNGTTTLRFIKGDF